MADLAGENFHHNHTGATRRDVPVALDLVPAALGQRLRGPVGGGFTVCDRLEGNRRGPAPALPATPPCAVARDITVKLG